jgi:cation diffusion facilitator family transporter
LRTDGSALKLHGDREKRLVALSSVLAAVFLTSMKLAVGLATGSLGILSEAAHSALDLVAAAVTFFAVRVSGRPPDREHNYGHGKIENLSALFETLLLLVTCIWIIYEATRRLFFGAEVEVKATIWSFVVMALSIVVDFSRSRVLLKAAKKYDSQALEADAIHFSTDIWSSSVVIAGLALVALAGRLGIGWLAKADAIAAMGVAAIVTYISIQLGSRTIAGLLDAVPTRLRDDVAHAVHVPGVLDVKKVRVRRSGPEAFADVELTVSRDTTFEEADEIAGSAEEAVRAVLPGADVMVHVVPVRASNEDVLATVRVLAARHGVGVHGIRLYDVLGNHSMDLHLEVNNKLSVQEAHRVASEFERALRQALPGIIRVTTHIEPAGETPGVRAAMPADATRVIEVLKAVPEETGIDFSPHDVRVDRLAGQLMLSFHVRFDPGESINDAHLQTEQIEQALRSRLPELARITIHVEPVGTNEA